MKNSGSRLRKLVAERLTIVSGVVIGSQQCSGKTKYSDPLIENKLINFLERAFLLMTLWGAMACQAEAEKPLYKITEGSQYELCHHYVELMNRVQPNPKSSCDLPFPFDKTARDQGFLDIPWEVLDKSKYRDVIKNYWMLSRKLTAYEMEQKENQEDYEEFFSELENIWGVVMDINFDGKKEKVYRLPVSGKCSGHRNVYFIGDPDISINNFSNRKVVGDAFYYTGRFYNYRGYHGLKFTALQETKGSENFVFSKYVCEFNLMMDE